MFLTTCSEMEDQMKTLNSRIRKNYIVDIDGVVCEDIPNERWAWMAQAKEIEEAKDRLNKLYDEGHIITFFTARTTNLGDITEGWLDEHGFKYHNIIYNKPRGGNYHYIDDKEIEATRFIGDWSLLDKE